MRLAAWKPSSQITVAKSRHSPDAASDDGQYAGIGGFSQATGSMDPPVRTVNSIIACARPEQDGDKELQPSRTRLAFYS
jgi:hypothetical protein